MAYSYDGLNTVGVEQFSLQFENEYQHENRILNGVTKEVHGVVGKDYVAKFADAWDLGDRGAFGSDITRTIVGYRKQLIEMSDKTALVASDIFEQKQVNASEISNEAKQAAMALVRMQDQIILNAMLNSTPDTTVTAGSNLTFAKLQEVKQEMDDLDVPQNDRYLVGTYSQQRSLLAEEKVTSSDYNTMRTLAEGQISDYYGFKFLWVSDAMSTGGLTLTGTTRKVYAFQKDAIITPYGMEPSVKIDWMPEAQSWVVVPKVRMGSEVVRTSGIVLINATES